MGAWVGREGKREGEGEGRARAKEGGAEGRVCFDASIPSGVRPRRPLQRLGEPRKPVDVRVIDVPAGVPPSLGSGSDSGLGARLGSNILIGARRAANTSASMRVAATAVRAASRSVLTSVYSISAVLSKPHSTRCIGPTGLRLTHRTHTESDTHAGLRGWKPGPQLGEPGQDEALVVEEATSAPQPAASSPTARMLASSMPTPSTSS